MTRILVGMLVLIASFLLDTTKLRSQNIAIDDQGWRFTVQQPGKSWLEDDFDDQNWQEAVGGFGTVGTPNSRVATQWRSEDIWLRKTVMLNQIPQALGLLVYHDEDAKIYLNGKLIATLPGFVTDYQTVALAAAVKTAAKVGRNVLAITCHQTTGGQFIDAHLVDLDNVPELPTVQRSSKPFESSLTTAWGEAVTSENAWTQYPRPAFVRSQWKCLNGNWNYQVTKNSQTEVPEQWAGKILVPFCIESKLSGVQRLLNPDQALWYQREFVVQSKPNCRWLLNFEAVDYECEVFLNGMKVGGHRGGSTPFSFDISTAAKVGKNSLIVRVKDETEGSQLRGKQVLNPSGIWYTQVSGIWQSVWLEQVSETYLKEIKVGTDAKHGRITVLPVIEGSKAEQSRVLVTVIDDGRVVAKSETQGQQWIDLRIDNAKLWTPDAPFLYDLRVDLIDPSGEKVDTVESYAGIRTVGKYQDENGDYRFRLNGEPIFHWGPLDQGWWPDGLLTPPSDEAMKFDIDFLKEAGFNMIRKHIKVEPRRYYEYCDRIGMMVWQDQVSGGPSPLWTRMESNPVDAIWTEDDHQQYLNEFQAMIRTLENHPSIVVWTPYNEAWGQHRTIDVGKWTLQRDPSRLVNVASGGNFWPIGDIADHHQYPHPDFPLGEKRFSSFVKVVGEFGGHGLAAEGHLWDEDRENWGYGGLPKDEKEYQARYIESIRRLADLKTRGIAAGVYTQTTDVEGEINGLMTYDRKVIKITAQQLKQIHAEAKLLD